MNSFIMMKQIKNDLNINADETLLSAITLRTLIQNISDHLILSSVSLSPMLKYINFVIKTTFFTLTSIIQRSAGFLFMLLFKIEQ